MIDFFNILVKFFHIMKAYIAACAALPLTFGTLAVADNPVKDPSQSAQSSLISDKTNVDQDKQITELTENGVTLSIADYFQANSSYAFALLDIPEIVHAVKDSELGNYIFGTFDADTDEPMMNSFAIAFGQVFSTNSLQINSEQTFEMGGANLVKMINAMIHSSTHNLKIFIESLVMNTGHPESAEDKEQLKEIGRETTKQYATILKDSKNYSDPLIAIAFDADPRISAEIHNQIDSLSSSADLSLPLVFVNETYNGIPFKGITINVAEMLEQICALAGETEFQEFFSEDTLDMLRETPLYIILNQLDDKWIVFICTNPETQAKKPNDNEALIHSPQFLSALKIDEKNYQYQSWGYVSESVITSYAKTVSETLPKWGENFKKGILKGLQQIEGKEQATITELPSYVNQFIDVMNKNLITFNNTMMASKGGAAFTLGSSNANLQLKIQVPFSMVLGNEKPEFANIANTPNALYYNYTSLNEELMLNNISYISSAVGLAGYICFNSFEFNAKNENITLNDKKVLAINTLKELCPKITNIQTNISAGLAPQSAQILTFDQDIKWPEIISAKTGSLPYLQYSYIHGVKNHTALSNAWKEIEGLVNKTLADNHTKLQFTTKDGTSVCTPIITNVIPEIASLLPSVRLNDKIWSFNIPGEYQPMIKTDVPLSKNQDTLRLRSSLDITKLNTTICDNNETPQGTKVKEIIEAKNSEFKSLDIQGYKNPEGSETYVIELNRK